MVSPKKMKTVSFSHSPSASTSSSSKRRCGSGSRGRARSLVSIDPEQEALLRQVLTENEAREQLLRDGKCGECSRCDTGRACPKVVEEQERRFIIRAYLRKRDELDLYYDRRYAQCKQAQEVELARFTAYTEPLERDGIFGPQEEDEMTWEKCPSLHPEEESPPAETIWRLANCMKRTCNRLVASVAPKLKERCSRKMPQECKVCFKCQRLAFLRSHDMQLVELHEEYRGKAQEAHEKAVEQVGLEELPWRQPERRMLPQEASDEAETEIEDGDRDQCDDLYQDEWPPLQRSNKGNYS